MANRKWRVGDDATTYMPRRETRAKTGAHAKRAAGVRTDARNRKRARYQDGN